MSVQHHDIKADIARWKDHSIPEQIISGVIQKNPHLHVVLGEKPGDFSLVDPAHPENKILFVQDRFAHSATHDGNKYIIDISSFDNSAAGAPPFSIANIYTGNPARRDVTAVIHTSERGIIDEQKFYAENEEKNLYLPVRFVDGRGVNLRLEGVIKPEVERREYLLDPRVAAPEIKAETKLFPTASMGKMLTGAMLIKACEQIEIALEKNGHAEATRSFLREHKATTLMDVPLTAIVTFLNSHQTIGDSELARQTLNLLAAIKVPKGADKTHHQKITPAMLINHAARIPNSFEWKNSVGQTLMENWRADEQAKADGETIVGSFTPQEPFLPEPIYSNGNMVVAGLIIEALSGKPIKENLKQIGAGDAVILTSRSVLLGRDYARVAMLDQRADKTGKPNDPGYTAGGYLATPETMAKFSQAYLSGEIFTRAAYKDYATSSCARVIDVKGAGKYSDGIKFEELGRDDPLSLQGFTHLAGHAGDTPNIVTRSLTAVKVKDGKITEVGPTHIAMATCDTREYETYTREHETYHQAKQQTNEEKQKSAAKYDLALPKHLEHLREELSVHRAHAREAGVGSKDDGVVSYRSMGAKKPEVPAVLPR